MLGRQATQATSKALHAGRHRAEWGENVAELNAIVDSLVATLRHYDEPDTSVLDVIGR